MKIKNTHCIFLVFLFFVFSLTTSCSSYIRQLYQQIDQNMDMETRNKNQKNGKIGPKTQKRRRLSALSNLTSEISSKNDPVIRPSIKRSYRSKKLSERRFRSEDFYDNSNNGSLWISENGKDFLLDSNPEKKIGDIILINVQNKLKNEISLELQRGFPGKDLFSYNKNKNKKKNKNKNKDKDKNKVGKNKKDEDKPGKRAIAGTKQIYDKISSVIVEEINKGHLLLRGRKGLLYKGEKRFIEVQALVARKSISLDSTVFSNDILELEIMIIKVEGR